jgi:hypothetical protein
VCIVAIVATSHTELEGVAVSDPRSRDAWFQRNASGLLYRPLVGLSVTPKCATRRRACESTARHGRHDEEVDRGRSLHMIFQECSPGLGRRLPLPPQIVGDCRLRQGTHGREENGGRSQGTLTADRPLFYSEGEKDLTNDRMIVNPAFSDRTEFSVRTALFCHPDLNTGYNRAWRTARKCIPRRPAMACGVEYFLR